MTGITGQDGSYLAELLLDAGYEVHGLVRSHGSDSSVALLQSLKERVGSTSDSLSPSHVEAIHFHDSPLEDFDQLSLLLSHVKPDEVYHLAAQSHVGLSFEQPIQTCNVNGNGTLALLEAVRQMESPAKLMHASSSEVFGKPTEIPQKSTTPMHPVSPYGASKAFASNLVRVYREHYGLFACNAFCYNHESPRRPPSFVTRKITQAAAHIKQGLVDELPLGNVESERDWGYAPDFVRGFHQLLGAETPQDVILATGTKHAVKDWLDVAFDYVGLNWQDFVKEDPRFYRKSDPCLMIGDPSEAEQAFGWRPETPFESMVKEMVDVDL